MILIVFMGYIFVSMLIKNVDSLKHDGDEAASDRGGGAADPHLGL